MSTEEYLTGALPALAAVVACLLAAELVRRRRLAHLSGAPAALAFAVVATAALMAVQLVPGALGVLSPAAALVGGCLLALGAWWVPAAPLSGPPEGSPAGPASGRVSWALAIVAGALVAGGLMAFVVAEAARAPTAIDALSFHIPGMVAALQEGSLWGMHQYLPGLAHTNYPQNGDLLYLHALAAGADLAFVRHVFVPWLALTGLGAYALARELGGPPATSALAGVAIVALPATSIPAVETAMPDPVMLFGFSAGLLFGLRHHRGGRRADLVLAGLALGLSFGAKWYALPAVALAVAVWLAARALGRHRPAALVREGGVVVALVAVAGGFWLLRNLVLTGNPLFPVRIDVAGVTLFDAPPDRIRELAGFTILDYLGSRSALGTYIVPAWNQTLGALWLLLGVGVLLALVPAARLVGPSRDPARRALGARTLAMGVLAVLLAAAYAITPYSALGPEGLPVQAAYNTRYVIPALLVAAAVVAWALGLLGRARPVAEALLALAAIVAGAQSFPPGPISVAAALLAIGVLLAARPAGRWAARRWSPGRRTVRVAGAAGLATALVAILVLGRVQVERFDLAAWRDEPVVAWLLDHPQPRRRIGLAGTWPSGAVAPILPAFGKDLDDRVAYVGPVEEGMLLEYRDPAAFRADLAARDLDLLIVGRGFPRPRPGVRELRWARAAGFEPVVGSERLVLLRAPRREPGPR